jgi:hypothetical protein
LLWSEYQRFFDLVENIQNEKKNIKYFYYEYQGFLGAFFGKYLGFPLSEIIYFLYGDIMRNLLLCAL